MAALAKLAEQALRIVSSIRFPDIIDILLVAFIIYRVLMMIRTTSAARVARGIVLLLLLTWLTSVANIRVLNYLLSKTVELGFLALVIMFQPELRRGLEKMGSSDLRELFFQKEPSEESDTMIVQVVDACRTMSDAKIGALIVFERSFRLDEYFKTGTVVDAKVSSELLKNIFFPKAALHDGAVIIRGTRVAAAGCVLPLTDNPGLSRELGTRHRAGIGMSEKSDAVVVLVSEETGVISLAVGGMLKRNLTPQTLEQLLFRELKPQTDDHPVHRVSNILKSFKVKKNEKNIR